MNKICTSVEQSKKLLELGVDINTADMHWMNEILFLSFDKVDKAYNDKLGYEYLPAWSLAALLSIIPKYIGDSVFRMDMGETNIALWFDDLSYGTVDEILPDITKENFVDACYEMIIKLKEQNLI